MGNVKFTDLAQPARRAAVAGSVLMYACLNKNPVSPSAALANAMEVHEAKEEDIAGDFYGAVFMLCRYGALETNTPNTIAAETSLWAPDSLLNWVWLPVEEDVAQDNKEGWH